VSKADDGIKSMAELLRSGATMIDLSCPACSSPLFRLKNKDIWCARCQKKVVVVKEGEKVEEPEPSASLGTTEAVLEAKISEINGRIQNESNLDELQKLSSVLSALLENLDKAKKLGKQKS